MNSDRYRDMAAKGAAAKGAAPDLAESASLVRSDVSDVSDVSEKVGEDASALPKRSRGAFDPLISHLDELEGMAILGLTKQDGMYGDITDLGTKLGQCYGFLSLVLEGSGFFSRALGVEGSILDLRTRDRQSYRRIAWKTMALIEKYCHRQRVPLGVLAEYSLSFNKQSASLVFWGQGVQCVGDVVRKDNNLPGIRIVRFRYIVRRDAVCTDIAETGRAIMCYRSEIHILGDPLTEKVGIDKGSVGVDTLVYIKLALKGVSPFVGVVGAYEVDKDPTKSECKNAYRGESVRVIYNVPLFGDTKKPLLQFPLQFLKTKFKKQCHKHYYADYGLGIEVDEDVIFDGDTSTHTFSRELPLVSKRRKVASVEAVDTSDGSDVDEVKVLEKGGITAVKDVKDVREEVKEVKDVKDVRDFSRDVLGKFAVRLRDEKKAEEAEAGGADGEK